VLKLLVSLSKHKSRPLFEITKNFKFLLYCENSIHPQLIINDREEVLEPFNDGTLEGPQQSE